MTTTNGVHDVSRDDYDRLDRVNWSTLKHMGKSPAHYRRMALDRQAGDTDAKKLGRCSHLATLEPEKFRSEVATWTGDRRAGKEWEAFKKKNNGRELLKQEQHDYCVEIGEAARSCAMAKPYLAGGHGEQTILWSHVVKPAPKPIVIADNDSPTVEALAQAINQATALDGYKIDCKGRVDFVADIGALVDLKTTRDASPEGFGRECARYEYHVQAAFYRDGFRSATGRDLPYIIVAVETSKPHVVQVYRVPDEILDLGRERYRALLDRLYMCRGQSDWPGYGSEVLDLTLPRWATPGEDEDVTGLDLVIGE